jgi:hypothetical protein
MLLYTHEARGPWWSEAFIMALAAVGFVAVMMRDTATEATTPLARFIAFYTLFLTAIYCVIPYKTPWSMLSFLHGMILLAGVGAMVLVHAVRKRPLQVLVGLLLAAGTVHLVTKAYNASYRFQADARNPYVHSATSPDILNLVRQVNEFAKVKPGAEPLFIELRAPGGDYWPLPFYLRRYPVIYSPGPYEPDLVVCHEAAEPKPEGPYEFVGYHGLRSTVTMWLYARSDLKRKWEEYVATRPPPGIDERR